MIFMNKLLLIVPLYIIGIALTWVSIIEDFDTSEQAVEYIGRIKITLRILFWPLASLYTIIKFIITDINE